MEDFKTEQERAEYLKQLQQESSDFHDEFDEVIINNKEK